VKCIHLALDRKQLCSDVKNVSNEPSDSTGRPGMC
jgi:hypothetical protein